MHKKLISMNPANLAIFYVGTNIVNTVKYQMKYYEKLKGQQNELENEAIKIIIGLKA